MSVNYFGNDEETLKKVQELNEIKLEIVRLRGKQKQYRERIEKIKDRIAMLHERYEKMLK